MRGKGHELERAQAALAKGRTGRATRHAWKAALRARQDGDEEGLEAVVGLASELRDGAEGAARQEAESVRVYAARCLDDLRAGIPHRSSMSWMFTLGTGRGKRCPDCAETVREEARVCRFCGFRFGG